MDKLLDLGEVAERIGHALSTVRSSTWRKRHGLRGVKIGSKILFEEATVEEFVKRHRERRPAAK